MLEALLLVIFASLSNELANVKVKEIQNEISEMQKGFIFNIFQLLVALLILFITNNWEYDINIFNILLTGVLIIGVASHLYVGLKSVVIADRSTMSLFSVLVLPMLVLADIFIGYNITIYHIVGVLFISVVLFISSFNGSINIKGLKYIILTQLIAFINITIFKYNVTVFNSVESQLIINTLFVSLIMGSVVLFSNGIKGFLKCFNPKYCVIGVFSGINAMASNMAFLFGPSSIIIAFKRMFGMFWGVVFGKIIFHEINFLRKMGNLGILSIGIFIINFQAFADNMSFVTNINLDLLKGDISQSKKFLNKNFDKTNLNKNYRHIDVMYNF